MPCGATEAAAPKPLVGWATWPNVDDAGRAPKAPEPPPKADAAPEAAAGCPNALCPNAEVDAGAAAPKADCPKPLAGAAVAGRPNADDVVANPPPKRHGRVNDRLVACPDALPRVKHVPKAPEGVCCC